MANIVCYGEILWDIFPDSKKLGGAPLNVAFRLDSLGNDTKLISAIGNDKNGEDIIRVIKSSIETKYIQTNNYPTGSVEVSLNEKGSATYSIVEDVAWDYIQINDTLKNLVSNSDAFIYGTLIARNEQSQKTLLELISTAKYNVLDLNLRPPHYNKATLSKLISNSDFLKINFEEYQEIFDLFGFKSTDIETDLKLLATAYDIEAICVTKGEDGVVLYFENAFYYSKAYKVKVADTVGAGDSFLATLIDGLFNQENPEKVLKRACAVGALVAAHSGANPQLDNSAIEELVNTTI